ncbi:5-oxoprolinase subunit PxpA [Pedobacter psychroterrae]|uniref:5-oxoprolinase subunit A n=1 Tax=Pedobacter psychroterrae TaxID=2530453 RepID=A0A4R0NE63_9SPHI|nr:5-oxoprolinase subunit PxpA [Pedobacter psychroterrae]TCC97422.1 LamB/YcsF family protein [Pedobacter psychroterrae]
MADFYTDLNCDMGESFGAYTMGNDEAIMPFISSVNIACGFHAGDPATMQMTVKAAIRHGLKIGAHPGFPDLQGFGRREMKLSATEVYNITLYQIGALSAFVKAEGSALHHVKPHGALYNMAAVNPELADAIAEAVYAANPSLILYGLSGSELIKSAERRGLNVKNEVFADRTYKQDGTLTPRSQAGALINDSKTAINQVMRMVKEGIVTSSEGLDIAIRADTICLHGDGGHALELAREISHRFKQEGIIVR